MTGMAVGAAAVTGGAFGWCGLVAVTAVVLALLLVTRGQLPAVVACLVLGATLLGAWRGEGVSRQSPRDALPPAIEGTQVRVDSDPVRTAEYQQFIVAPWSSSGQESNSPDRICVTSELFPRVRFADLLRITGEVRGARDVGAGPRAYLQARSCTGSLFAESVLVTGASGGGLVLLLADVRSRIGLVLRESAPGDAGVLLSGLVTGDDAAFSQEREAAFIRTGTTHLTAVSGSNLALVAGILATAGTATLGRHRIAWQVITIAGIWAYALISGSQPPAVRAAIVATAAILAFRFGRSADYPTLILLAAGIMVLVDPAQVDSLGFRLSVASSLALAVVLPALIRSGKGSGLAGVVAASVAAQMATLPFLLPIFGTVALAGLPANLLVAPLIVVAMPLAAAAGLIGLVSTPVAEVVAVPAAFAATAALAVVDVLGTPRAYVGIGIPPLEAAIPLTLASLAVLVVISEEATRGLRRLIERYGPSPGKRAEAEEAPSGRHIASSAPGTANGGSEAAPSACVADLQRGRPT